MASLASDEKARNGVLQSEPSVEGIVMGEDEGTIGDLSGVEKYIQELIQVTDTKRWVQLSIAQKRSFKEMLKTQAAATKLASHASYASSHIDSGVDFFPNHKSVVTDIVFCNAKDTPPAGYKKIEMSSEGNKRAEFGKILSSDQNICLCVQCSDDSEERAANLRIDQGSDQNSENRRNHHG